jgi:large conductance mechanosensitive channel
MRMLKDFKEFAMKGNVVDLAVAVIIGAAFGKIIGSLVDDIIMPVIGAIAGGLDFSNHFIGLSKAVTSPVYAEAKQGAVLGWGSFLTVTVNFLIIAFILFLVIRALSMLKKSEPAAPPPSPPRSEVLLEEIKDSLVARNADLRAAPQRTESLLGEIRDLLAKQ